MEKPAEILFLEKTWGLTFTRLTGKEFERKRSKPDFIQKCFYASNKENKVWGMICRMELEEVNALTLLTDLTTLDLNYNQLSDVSALASMTKLTHLSLVGNYLRNVSDLASLTELTYLDLSDNQLSDVSILAPLTKLTYIDLSYNQLRDVNIPASFIHLKTLNISQNLLQIRSSKCFTTVSNKSILP